MRIAFVSDSAYPWFNGGIERRRFIIMRRMASQGNDVHCFTMFRPGMPSKDFTFKGIKYHCAGEALGWQGLMYTGGGKRRSVRMPLLFSLRLFFRIAPYGFDIVDADSFPFLHIIPLYIYTRLRRIRLVVTWHEVWSREFWKRYLRAPLGNLGYFVERICAGMADMNIANASTTKRLIMNEFGTDAGKIVVFPAAIDKDEILSFTSGRRCVKKNRFVVVSRLVKHKRIELAINAIAKTNAKLVVVGVGPELKTLERLARARARGKVIFRHGLSTRAIFKEMCESKALIMPSEREGLSLVTIEALALGTRVVIVNTSSLPREVRRYCTEVKEDGLGNALNRIASDRRSHEESYKRISGRVIETFSGDRAGEVYKRIVDRLGE